MRKRLAVMAAAFRKQTACSQAVIVGCGGCLTLSTVFLSLIFLVPLYTIVIEPKFFPGAAIQREIESEKRESDRRRREEAHREIEERRAKIAGRTMDLRVSPSNASITVYRYGKQISSMTGSGIVPNLNPGPYVIKGIAKDYRPLRLEVILPLTGPLDVSLNRRMCPDLGEDGYIQIETVGGTSKDAMGAVIDAHQVNDPYALKDLVLSGQLEHLQKGNKVRVIGGSFSMAEVRVIEGSSEGSRLWVPREWVDAYPP